jgi:hypothetical protein
VKIEPAVWVGFCGITVDYSHRHNVRIIWISAADGDSFAEEINVTVTWTGVSSQPDLDNIAMAGGVKCDLDVVEIGWAVVVNGYDSTCLHSARALRLSARFS